MDEQQQYFYTGKLNTLLMFGFRKTKNYYKNVAEEVYVRTTLYREVVIITKPVPPFIKNEIMFSHYYFLGGENVTLEECIHDLIEAGLVKNSITLANENHPLFKGE